MKSTNIDGIEITVEHCNGSTPCPHFNLSGWCFHPVFDKGQKRADEDLRASYMIDNPIPKDCPLPDVCPECNEPIENKKCESSCCQKVRD